MTIPELLAAVRGPYIEALSRAATGVQAHVEPAYRRGDGALTTEGPSNLPCRADFIPKEGASAGQALRVDSAVRLSFEPISFRLGTAGVTLNPFDWDCTPVAAEGPDRKAISSALRTWFIEWFDAEDRNEPTEDNLYGVVHFMSEPEPTAEGWRTVADLGSSPARALEDLLFRLTEAGATQIHVGTTSSGPIHS